MRKSAFFDLAFALPELLVRGADAARDTSGLPQRSEIDNIVIQGLGTGRSAGLVVRAVSAATIPVPILVESSYEIPGCVGRRSLVFALSGRETPTRSIMPPRPPLNVEHGLSSSA